MQSDVNQSRNLKTDSTEQSSSRSTNSDSARRQIRCLLRRLKGPLPESQVPATGSILSQMDPINLPTYT
jgi:hypothetical protein